MALPFLLHISSHKCTMNVVLFFKGAVLARSRPAYDVPCTEGGDRTEEGREALPGSNSWSYHQQSGPKCIGLWPSP